MAKNIKAVVDRIGLLIGKKETGYYTPNQIVEEVNRQQYDLYKNLIDEYSRTRRISELLQPFMSTAILSFSGGSANKPETFAHHISLRTDNATVETLEHYEFETRRNHVNKSPSTNYPIARYLTSTIEILPATITSGTIEFFKLPTVAVYAYSVVGDDYVYNDTTSVALDWSEEVINKITLGTLSKLGIPIDDRDLVQYGLLQEDKTRP